MARRRALAGILANFLGHFTSRNADYHGYWIFGMLVADLTATSINLLGADDAEAGPSGAAVRLARQAFRDQLARAGLEVSKVREACLNIVREPVPVKGQVNGSVVGGYNVAVSAKAVSDFGGVYTRGAMIFVAPHDAGLERRSSRALHPT